MGTRFLDSSSTFHDLSKKSKLIREGPPARYRLLTTRSNLEKDASVRKWTFGQRDVNMENKILLMVGESRTGKTTLINAMVNYILGVKFTDEVWFEITEEGGDNDMSDQSQNQTTKITMYEVFAQDKSVCLTILDTPGFGNTRGENKDQEIAENLYKLFDNDTGVKEIDAVCLVVKASDNRRSDRQEYIFDAIWSLFAKDIKNNIVILITNSDGFPPTNVINAIMKAGLSCRTNEEKEPEYFLFNNQQTEKRTKKNEKAQEEAWKQTEDSLQNLFASLKVQKRELQKDESVFAEYRKIKSKYLSNIQNLQNCVNCTDCKGKKLAEIQKALEETRKKIKSNEELTFTVTVCYKEKVPIENASWWDRKATTCSVCEENCHEYNCWCAWDVHFCSVMSNDHCIVCPGKCHYNKHVRENKKYVTRSKEIIMTFNDLESKHESNDDSTSNIKFDSKAFDYVKADIASNKQQEEEKTCIEEKLKEELAKNKEENAKLVEETCIIIIKLSEIALKSDSAFLVQCLDFLIPRAEETGKDDLAQKLRELRKIKPESEERVKAVMQYVGVGFSTSLPENENNESKKNSEV